MKKHFIISIVSLIVVYAVNAIPQQQNGRQQQPNQNLDQSCSCVPYYKCNSSKGVENLDANSVECENLLDIYCCGVTMKSIEPKLPIIDIH